MKKLTLITFTAATMLLCTKPVSAAAINLICSEKQGTEAKKTTRSGETEKRITELWSIPTTIDTVTGRATMWGKGREMSVEPEKLILREEIKEKTTNRDALKFSKLEINRKSLAFTYYWFYNIIDSRFGMLNSSTTTRNSTGICTKIQETKNNKI